MNFTKVFLRRPNYICWSKRIVPASLFPITHLRQLHIYPQLLRGQARKDSTLLRNSFITLCTVGLLGSAYYEYKYHGVRKYPSNIRQPLRKALLYHKYKEDPATALPYYELAVELALNSSQLGRSSPEVTGLIIQFGTFYEDEKNWEKAIETYTQAFNLLISENENKTPNNEQTEETLVVAHPETPLTGEKLIRAVGIAQKLGELYEKIQNRNMAEKYYVWAVEHLLVHRVDKNNSQNSRSSQYFELPEWITPTDIGASLESLAAFYATDRKYQYAIPLYIRALSTLDEAHCHASVIMCNLSEAFAGLGQYKEALRWAKKGLSIARHGMDTAECDQSCGVLLYNLGMIQEMSGETDNAIKYYTQSMNHARKIGYKECQREATQALDSIRREAEISE